MNVCAPDGQCCVVSHTRTPTGEVQAQLLQAGAVDRLLRLVHPDEPPASLTLALDTLRALGNSDEHCRVRLL